MPFFLSETFRPVGHNGQPRLQTFIGSIIITYGSEETLVILFSSSIEAIKKFFIFFKFKVSKANLLMNLK